MWMALFAVTLTAIAISFAAIVADNIRAGKFRL
jgi:hypothetical protein